MYMHYYKMWVQFTSPRSLDQWIHCFFIGPCSLQPVNSFKIYWNAYKDTFCYSDVTTGLFIYGNGALIQQPKRANSIHNQVENRLEVRLMEDHHLIHLLDFMDGKHLI